ncbi:MAG TPA: Rep family protein [Lactobacillaceae bacterium]|jgi:hypothetical protein
MSKITLDMLDEEVADVPAVVDDDAITTGAAGKKYRQFMYVQQLDHLGLPIDELVKQFEQMDALEWAMIVHDKDTKADDFAFVAPHVHAVLKFEHPHSLQHIADQLQDKPQHLAIWKGRINNAYSYLVHRTAKSRDRYQYDPGEVVASFDFDQRLATIEGKVKQRTQANDAEQVNAVLDAIVAGEVESQLAAYALLPGHLISKAMPKIKAAFQAKLELDAQIWREAKLASGQKIEVYWFYGAAGTGKTRFAKEYAAKLTDGRVYIAGSSRDPFQSYNGEHVVILDDLRPKEGFTFSDMLRMLDPWNSDAMASSRYFDKALQADYFFITSPFAPIDFYNKLVNGGDSSDGVDQLVRRLTLVIAFDGDYLTHAFPYHVRGNLISYQFDVKTRQPNKWTDQNGRPFARIANLMQNLKTNSQDQFSQVIDTLQKDTGTTDDEPTK